MVTLNNLVFVDADTRFCFKEIWQQEPTPTIVHVVLHIEAVQLMKWALLNVYVFMYTTN